MANINKIRLSGTTYNIEDANAAKTVELTQAQYDALVTGGTVDPNTFYIITDATAVDLTQYWTSAQTQSAITSAVSTKQDTLVSGTNIKTINNESILGSGNIDIQGGGGKAIEAGRGISVTTGATADTVSFNLPISADSNTYINAGAANTIGDNAQNILIGSGNTAYDGGRGTVLGGTAIGFGNEVGYIGLPKHYQFAFGFNNKIHGGNSYAIGVNNNIGRGGPSSKDHSYLIGYYNTCTFNGDSSGDYIFGNHCTVSKSDEFALGKYNASNTGSTDADRTFFSVGNGTADNARHNAFEIRQNGDIYLSSGGTDIKLQDHLGGGGGGSTYTAGDGIDITNDVISVTGKVDTSTYETYTAATATAIGNKLATSDFNTYSGTVDTAINSKASQSDLSTLSGTVTAHTADTTIHVTSANKTSWDGAATNASNAVTALGGLSLVKLTQAQYDALVTKDNSTLYVIVN